QRAASNAPVFICAFFTACAEVAERFGANNAPDIGIINRLLEKHGIGYVVDPPNLRLREAADIVPVHPTTLLQQAQERLRNAAERSEELLRQNKGEEAVTHIWWLLESVSTAFSGADGKRTPDPGGLAHAYAATNKAAPRFVVFVTWEAWT
ncbi:MAG: hypothetical protein WAM69_18930, partial [Candidatus Sulfotelmatobacter sp.]